LVKTGARSAVALGGVAYVTPSCREDAAEVVRRATGSDHPSQSAEPPLSPGAVHLGVRLPQPVL